jgi:pyruvate formate lyase activating enzyme
MSWSHEYLLYDPGAIYRSELTGLISDFQRFSIHDGPGIRTLVFMKGCPLHCAWCANPETIIPRPEIMLIPHNCIGCGKCIEACPSKCLAQVDRIVSFIDRDKCLLPECGKCQRVCYANAVNISGRYLTVEEVMDVVLRDREFYDRTGGGVTISGGEPFAQPVFLMELVRTAKILKLHTAIETCGQVNWNIFNSVLEHLDYVLYDLKHMDSNRHLQGTGVDNRIILENAKRLGASGKPVRIRLPLIPDFNDSEENVRATAEFIAEFSNLEALDILPYHRMGEPKWGQLHQEYKLQGVVPHNKERVFELADIARKYGIEVTVGG